MALILIVDDSPTEVHVMQKALERHGYQTASAGDGAEDPDRPDPLIDELAENLRAILRDALCGHLDSDLVSVADELLAEAAQPAGPAAVE